MKQKLLSFWLKSTKNKIKSRRWEKGFFVAEVWFALIYRLVFARIDNISTKVP